ncbi:isopropylmalate isomerase [Marinobacter sp. NFXS11]|uniref:isopropylmalate isomerase n=1 Tax=Marinobacter sp. NFXS11 TaxID=2818432 RepID=UPI0032DE367C
MLMVGSAALLSGCVATPSGETNGSNRQAFLEQLYSDPQACQSYREAYVRGFRENVSALAQSDEAGQQEAERALVRARERLLAAGMTEPDCARPYCIIEPLQDGKLDAWCGYRLDADTGEELYQWLDWETVQAAVQRQ